MVREMTFEDLRTQTGFVLFIFEDGSSFYIKTHLRLQHDYNCLLDLMTNKQIKKKYFSQAKYSVLPNEPSHLKEESDFLKQFM